MANGWAGIGGRLLCHEYGPSEEEEIRPTCGVQLNLIWRYDTWQHGVFGMEDGEVDHGIYHDENNACVNGHHRHLSQYHVYSSGNIVQKEAGESADKRATEQNLF